MTIALIGLVSKYWYVFDTYPICRETDGTTAT